MALTCEIKDGKYHIKGVIDENTNLVQSLGTLPAGSVLDLSGIERINSTGVKGWIQFFSANKGETFTYVNCGIAIVEQLNMVKSFSCGAKIESFQAPYICPKCSHEEKALLPATPGLAAAPVVPCPKCGHSEMDFDDLEEEYFSFLR